MLCLLIAFTEQITILKNIKHSYALSTKLESNTYIFIIAVEKNYLKFATATA